MNWKKVKKLTAITLVLTMVLSLCVLDTSVQAEEVSSVAELEPGETATLENGLTLTVDSTKIIFDTDTVYTTASNDTYTPSGAYTRNSGYPTVLELKYQQGEYASKNGTLIAQIGMTPTEGTMTNSKKNTVAVIAKSEDKGDTWTVLSTPHLEDSTTYSNLADWPVVGAYSHLYELPAQVGAMPAGTLLFAANVYGKGASYVIIWRSYDCGITWEAYSTVCDGIGEEQIVWEPHLIYSEEDNYLYCFFANDFERDSTDSVREHQDIAVKRSEDGVSWSERKNVVADTTTNKSRPGMPQVTKLGNGKYFIVYEVWETAIECHYKITDSLWEWDSSDFGTALYRQTDTGAEAVNAAPGCIWLPVGGNKGTLIVTSLTGSNKGYVMVSSDYGASWEEIANPISSDSVLSSDTNSNYMGYSPSMCFSSDGKTLYYMNSTNHPTDSAKQTMKFSKLTVDDSNVVSSATDVGWYEVKNNPSAVIGAGESVWTNDASGSITCTQSANAETGQVEAVCLDTTLKSGTIEMKIQCDGMDATTTFGVAFMGEDLTDAYSGTFNDFWKNNKKFYMVRVNNNDNDNKLYLQGTTGATSINNEIGIGPSGETTGVVSDKACFATIDCDIKLKINFRTDGKVDVYVDDGATPAITYAPSGIYALFSALRPGGNQIALYVRNAQGKTVTFSDIAVSTPVEEKDALNGVDLDKRLYCDSDVEGGSDGETVLTTTAEAGTIEVDFERNFGKTGVGEQGIVVKGDENSGGYKVVVGNDKKVHIKKPDGTVLQSSTTAIANTNANALKIAFTKSGAIHVYADNGQTAVVSYVPDENGYKATGDQMAYFGSMSSGAGCFDFENFKITEGDFLCEEITGMTVTLGEKLGMNFHMKFSDRTLADNTAYMEFTMPNGSTEKVMVSEAPNTVYGKKMTCNHIAAKEMACDIKMKLVTAMGTYEYDEAYSVEDYMKEIIAASDTYGEETVALAKATLNYGAAAQNMFEYNTDNLANRSLSEAERVIAPLDADSLSEYARKTSGSVTGVIYVGTTTVWKDTTCIRHYFRVTEGTEVTCKVGNKEVELQQGGTYGSYIQIDGILPSEMSTCYEVTVTDGTGTLSIEYGVYSYFYAVLKDNSVTESDITKTAMRAAYYYSEAAKAYATQDDETILDGI